MPDPPGPSPLTAPELQSDTQPGPQLGQVTVCPHSVIVALQRPPQRSSGAQCPPTQMPVLLLQQAPSATGVPSQVPFVQVSPVVQGLPSSHVAPVARQLPSLVQHPPSGQGLVPEQGTQTLSPEQIGVVPPHVPPQLTVPPQMLGIVPQFASAGHVLSVQPQTFGLPGLPPPHVSGAVQVPEPHRACPPHPSSIVPQSRPTGQLLG